MKKVVEANNEEIKRLKEDMVKKEQLLVEQSSYIRSLKKNIFDFESELCTLPTDETKRLSHFKMN
jgi:hypothetical protein